ncbi:MAG: hypothetical protein RL210_1279, partial [Pseudomonadota bacterium]
MALEIEWNLYHHRHHETPLYRHALLLPHVALAEVTVDNDLLQAFGEQPTISIATGQRQLLS